MKICVLSGSPKGKDSITFQTILYLQKCYPGCDFDPLFVGAGIKKYEKDFSDAEKRIAEADMLLFCYPVYTFIVPYQLHRFMELMKQHPACLAGKCALQISTSKHFYDVTAHRFVEENCNDMELPYLGGLSLDMEDLLSEKGRAEIRNFWELITWRYENRIFLSPVALPARQSTPYLKNNILTEKKEGKKVVIVSSGEKRDAELSAMITDFCDLFAYPTEVVELADYPFRGGCLGCLSCAADGVCVYRDGFDEFLRTRIQGGNAILYAFRIQDHSMGSLMKLYDDRQFCNGHRTVTMGSPIGYLVLGDLDTEPNLREILVARADVGGNFLSGIATDGAGVATLAKTLAYALEHDTEMPSTFYGVGGTRIFRDLIWLMRGMMKADHKFFKEHDLYDFPQKKRGTLFKMKLVGALISNPKIKAKMGNKMTEGMLAPYKKVIDGVPDPEQKT